MAWRGAGAGEFKLHYMMGQVEIQGFGGSV